MQCSASDISIDTTNRYVFSVTYGEWIKAIREKEGLSQTRFAERINMKPGSGHVSISNLERGKFKPDRETIERIVAAFPMAPPPPRWPDAPKTNGSPKMIAVSSYEAREVAVRLDKQPREVRKQVRDIVERILRRPRRQPSRSRKPGPPSPKSGR